MQSKKKSKLKPGQLIKAFDFKVDKKDYIRSLALSNDGKLLYVAFAWNNAIRVFNLKLNKEESKTPLLPLVTHFFSFSTKKMSKKKNP